jgi:hypothetical protein
MPMVIPVVAAFAAGAAGVTALGAAAAVGGIAGTVATVAAYATIAGAVLTGVGALTGSKDLMKIGAVLSIGGGLGTMGVNAISAASSSGAAASGVSGAEAAASSADVAGFTALESASMSGGAAAAPGGAITSAAATPAGVTVDGATAYPVLDVPKPTVPPAAAGSVDPMASMAGPGGQSPLATNGTAGMADGLGDYGSSVGRGAAGTSEVAQPSSAVMDRLAKAGEQLNSQDLSTWWTKMKDAGGAVGEFIKKNPELVKIGGGMLESMYGPKAEQFDFEKSIYERRIRNLNSPVAMGRKT